ncbi:MAG: M20 metallopeptidase family protein [Oscillospiraceae bacterium]|jgi:amidohydrolase
MNRYLSEAQEMSGKLVEVRRTVHGYAELGFELPRTKALVKEKLKELGIEPSDCGKAGVTATIGSGGKTVLLRGDMDALPMKEESGLPFASTTGSCHSCGHDMHTTMLLGAAALLKKHESELKGTVKLMFQPAEEVLAGAEDMISAGIMENPKVDAAIGMHVIAGPKPKSDVGRISYKKGYYTVSGDFVRVTCIGLAAHGSTPEAGVDAINIAAHTVLALNEILSREVSCQEKGSVVLVGKIEGGASCNTEAGSCTLEVSVRAASEERREFLKNRVKEISENVAAAFRGKAKVEFVYGIGAAYNNPELCEAVAASASKVVGEDMVSETFDNVGTEDFAAVTKLVPSVYIQIGAGSAAGENITQHNPKIIFDEKILPIGAAVYAQAAEDYLNGNS